MAKDRSFAAKMSKKDGDQEAVPTALVVKPIKSEGGSYKFKRILVKMTSDNKKELGI